MSERYQLIAYLATLGTLVIIFIGSLIIGSFSDGVVGKIEAFGLGTITGGLIGVLRMPTRQTPTANVERADSVTQEAQS